MPKSDLHIDILGTELTISTDEDQDYLDALLSKYRQTIENVKLKTGLKDPLKIAVLTGFLLCDDLEKAGTPDGLYESKIRMGPNFQGTSTDDKNQDQGEAERLALSLISRLDELVTDSTCQDCASDNLPSVAKLVSGTIFKLQNTVKNYSWGSAEWIPALLGQKNISRIPWAELWMGVNPAGPSSVVFTKETESSESGQQFSELLSDLIMQDKEGFLGKETVTNYGNLPFLFKVLAAAKPLSIQVHPNREQAREGFERENRERIPLDAPNRNYRDSNHKSEIICALGPFMALCGFREAAETGFLIELLSLGGEGTVKAEFEKLLSILKQEGKPLKSFLSSLFSMEADALKALGLFLTEQQESLERDFPEYKNEWALCSYLASLYPGDPGMLAPLYLNIVELSKGQAIYLPTGVLHSYIHGLGIELMTDSDNVLRGGLTAKHIDTDELFKVINFSAYHPEIIAVPDPPPSWFSYPTPSWEFVLSVMQCSESSFTYHKTGPSILIFTEGGATVTDSDDQTLHLKAGESVFIPPRKSLIFSGSFTAYSAAAKVGREEIPTEGAGK